MAKRLRESLAPLAAAAQRAVDPMLDIQRRLSVADLSPARVQRGTGRDPDSPEDDESPVIDDFDEHQFTDEYFQSWEGDIESDEDWAALHESEVSGGSGDLRTSLRERQFCM